MALCSLQTTHRGQGRSRGRGTRGGAAGHQADDDLQWTDVPTNVTVEPFTEEVGSRVPLSTRILEIFQLFFTTTLIDLIVEQTNLYASQVMDPTHYEKWTVMDPTHYEKWTKVTAEEILAYFGFMILMGINHLPSLADYWKLDPMHLQIWARS